MSGATDYLSVAEAANRFGLTPNLIHNLVHRGRLHAARVRCGCHSGPPRLYLDPDEIDRYLARRRRPTSRELRERILAAAAAGLGASAIARQLDADRSTVGRILRANGIKHGRGRRTDLADAA